MALNPAQREAVEYIEGPLLVLAGPGTGKTHLLSARVEQILKVTDTNPENILCLTFTESGANNMRARLLASIGQAARKVKIHTYHAFGSDLLIQYKNYAEQFERRLDNAIDEVKQYKIIKEIQAELAINDILKSAKIEDLISTIKNAKEARLTGEDLMRIAEVNLATSEQISQAISPILQAAKRGARAEVAIAQTYLPILEILGTFCSPQNILKEIEPVANLLTRELNRIIEQEQAQEKPSVKVLTAWRNAVFEKDERGEYRLKDRIANKKLYSLGNIMQRYHERLEREGLFDFPDMIEQAIQILKHERGFCLTMSERFQYILLDEFQDTNPSQAELVRLLTDYERPNVMAVGDDDQAIFAFQGADASNLLNFQQYYQAKVVNLRDNYRSNQEILDFSRKIADQIGDSFAKNESVKALGLSKKLQAAKGPGGKLSRHEFLTSDAEYSFVAQEIEKLLAAGVQQNEIAVIAPKHKYIISLLPFLKESEKIKVAYEKRDNLLEDPRLSEILTLARLINDLAQGKNVASRLLEILAFPFWQIPPAEALATVAQAREAHRSSLEYLLSAKSEQLRDLGNFLAKLTMLSFDTPLELMLDYLIGSAEVEIESAGSSSALTGSDTEVKTPKTKFFRSPFLAFYAQTQTDYASFELYENLAVLKEAILAHSGNAHSLRLANLVDLIDDYEAAGVSLSNTSPYRDAAEAVQLMTAHKAKGLEFEYVFLIAMDDLSWGDAKGNNNTLVLPKNLIQIRHTGATDDERLRLLFVAITRAKQTLIMTNSLKDFAGKDVARLDYLAEYENEAGEVISPYLNAKVELHYGDLADDKECSNLVRSWRSAYLQPVPELREILLARMENYHLSPTDLKDFIDLRYAGPLEFYLKRIIRAPREPLDANLAFGNLIHQIFEQINREKIDNQEALSRYRQLAEASDLGAPEIRQLLERGEQALKISLEQFGPILRSRTAKAEVNLEVEHPVFKGTPLTGKIDHLELDEQSKTIEVYDFKTGKYKNKAWKAELSLFSYAVQLIFYKIILEHSPSYQNYQVVRGHILFVSPDEEGQVHDKVLDFGHEAELVSLVEQLIPKTYQLIHSLAFLDQPALCRERNEAASMKEIKEFIALILAQ